MNKADPWRREEGIGDPPSQPPDHCQAGPSRLRDAPYTPYEPTRRQPTVARHDGAKQPKTLARREPRRRRPPHPASPLTLLPAFLLPFLHPVGAAPAPAPPPPVPTSRTGMHATRTVSGGSKATTPPLGALDRRVIYPANMETPTKLPTDVVVVDETALPYLLTQLEDGTWKKADGGWYLYGRKVAQPSGGAILANGDGDGTVTDSQTTQTAKPSYAVEQALPNGWGTSSNRTSIYKVPLISVASVIMALLITALIIFYVLGRRKRHRKQKRAKERMRRKALAAAGLNESDINGSAAEAVFKEQLAEMEAKHKAKKKREGQMEFASGKVRGWNARLAVVRRRKGPRKEKGKGTTEVLEEENSDGEIDRTIVEESPPSAEADVPIVSPSRAPSPAPSSHSTPPPVETPAPPTEAPYNPLSSPTPYFPPAYRPASVRSVPAASASAGPSHPSSSRPLDDAGPTHVEKTQAPGYYPAPATEDGERALAVASRSDGKGRVVDVDQDQAEVSGDDREESRRAHVATDDKWVLERLRMGASAPPAAQEADERGPSAPEVMLDEQGFEIPAVLDEGDDLYDQPSQPSTAFPAPPMLSRRLAQFHNLDGPSPSAPSAPPTESSPEIPSAPPALDGEIESLAPSAPPMEDEQVLPELDSAPSAPPPIEEEDEGHDLSPESSNSE
ncbi:hypothetical protein B9479_004676 [Cryptococcus floricola]|uniref:Uncharacterized protein n=1 Tax=Cryptococcus floricola TaxID=2591691 RepID=A0A5D3AUX4_9TREE|nr:hypothetical protein B9479_004676 [Cryptococcus floricola]